MFRLVFLMCPLVMVGASMTQAQNRAELDSISVHLFLNKAGMLSEDVENIEGFGAWNFAVQGTGIGPGERFYSFLIKVRMTAAREIFAKGRQAEVTVTDRRTRRVIKRERISDVYIGPHGWTIWPVFVADGACGPFEIVASARGKKIVKALEAACGE